MRLQDRNAVVAVQLYIFLSCLNPTRGHMTADSRQHRAKQASKSRPKNVQLQSRRAGSGHVLNRTLKPAAAKTPNNPLSPAPKENKHTTTRLLAAPAAHHTRNTQQAAGARPAAPSMCTAGWAGMCTRPSRTKSDFRNMRLTGVSACRKGCHVVWAAAFGMCHTYPKSNVTVRVRVSVIDSDAVPVRCGADTPARLSHACMHTAEHEPCMHAHCTRHKPCMHAHRKARAMHACTPQSLGPCTLACTPQQTRCPVGQPLEGQQRVKRKKRVQQTHTSTAAGACM
jgi:hypothetical protein